MEPIPAELFEPAEGPPVTDYELDAYFAERDGLNTRIRDLDDDGADEVLTTEHSRAHGFVILDDGAAEWAMAKYAEAAAEVDAIKARHAEVVRRLEARLAEQVRRPEDRAEFFGSALEAYAAAERRRDPRRKSLMLTTGTVSTREVKDAPAVVDADSFIEWAFANMPLAVRTKHSPAMTELKKAVKIVNGKVVDATSGEVVPGCEVEPGRISVTVKADGAKGGDDAEA